MLAPIADGVDPDHGRQEIEKAIAEFPQAEVQTNAEFRDDQEGQINQLLVVISVLLGVRDRDLVLRHRDHARAVGVRAHARDRPAAGGRHEPPPDCDAPCDGRR